MSHDFTKGWRLIDLGSLESTCLNGQRLTPHAPTRALVSGDLLTFGTSFEGVRLTGRRSFKIRSYVMRSEGVGEIFPPSGEYFEEIGGDDKTPASDTVAGWKESAYKLMPSGDKQEGQDSGSWDYVLRRASFFLNKITAYCLDNPPPLPNLSDFVVSVMEDITHLR